MRAAALALLLLGSCGSGAPEQADEKGAVDVPVPSGPPIAQQADAMPSTAPESGAPRWELQEEETRVTLRLHGGDGAIVMRIGCARGGALFATVPAFTAIGSEERFSLGIGNEPVTLVADPMRQPEGEVTGEGSAPEGFHELLEEAKQVSASYGAQQSGPHPAPPEAMVKAFNRECFKK